MASILSLIAGLVVGVIAGWLLRGRQIARTQSTEANIPAQPTGSAVEASAAEASTVEASAVEAADTEKAPALVGAKSADADGPAPAPIAVAEPVAAEPVAAAPAEVERVEFEPAAAEPVATEPVATEPVVAEPVVAEPVIAEPATVELVETETIVVQTIAEPDDLTKVAGIGPKMAMALAAAGITTFEQLAATPLVDIRAAVTAAGMRLAPSAPTWAEQAKALAGLTD